jgi:hypothetical protein
MIELTYSKTVAILDSLVAEFGEDYVYKRPAGGDCVYVHDGAPSCIVGHLLARVGVPLERLSEADRAAYGGGLSAGVLLNVLSDEGVLRYDHDVSTLLADVQYYQDGGRTWKESVQYGLNS